MDSNKQPTVYEIKTIDDFLKLPESAIDKALAEFVPAIKAAHAMHQLAKTMAEISGASPDTVPMTIPCMRFVDDDKKAITFNLGTIKEASHDDK